MSTTQLTKITAAGATEARVAGLSWAADGWYPVERVNAKSVTIRSNTGSIGCVPYAMVVEVRSPEPTDGGHRCWCDICERGGTCA